MSDCKKLRTKHFWAGMGTAFRCSWCGEISLAEKQDHLKVKNNETKDSKTERCSNTASDGMDKKKKKV